MTVGIVLVVCILKLGYVLKCFAAHMTILKITTI